MTYNELQKAAKEAERDQHARGYFPKSIRNSDTFHLNVVAAEVGSAIHKATS